MSPGVRFWIAVLVGIASAVAAVWAVGQFKFAAVAFVADVTTAAIKVVTSLLILTLLIERSLAIINTTLFGREKRKLEEAQRKVKFELEVDICAWRNPVYLQ